MFLTEKMAFCISDKTRYHAVWESFYLLLSERREGRMDIIIANFLFSGTSARSGLSWVTAI